MKSAVLHELAAVPRYEDLADPGAGDSKVVVEIKAIAMENVDKAVAAGNHFAARQFLPQLPSIVAFDGIGILPGGTRVGFGQPGPFGTTTKDMFGNRVHDLGRRARGLQTRYNTGH